MMYRYSSVLLLSLLCGCGDAWTTAPTPTTCSIQRSNNHKREVFAGFFLVRRNTNAPDDWTELPPEFDDGDQQQQPKLGIDISSYMEPLSAQEAAELKAAATEIINDAVAAGLDDIEAMRRNMRQAVDKKRAEMARRSELRAQRESERLLNKIDQLTEDFLAQSKSSRITTQLAAAADQQARGRGVEHGSWGTIGGASVSMMSSSSSTTAATSKDATAAAPQQQQNRIIMLADASSADPYAKQLVPALTKELQKLLAASSPDSAAADLDVVVYKPTATVPIGGDGAAAVILFCTSYTDKSSVTTALDRLLRRTIGNNARPPTQIVVISTIGTERTNKMPYSMQNVLSGGKLEKRRQMEEAVVRMVKQRVVTPPLDYTICKLGELKDNCVNEFAFAPGDTIDTDGGCCLSLDTAVTVLTQAIALQPAARNATFSCAGNLVVPVGGDQQKFLDDAFLRLDGPELLRIDLGEHGTSNNFDQLTEYVREWAFLLAESGKGLTTPIRVEDEIVLGPQQAAMAYAAGVERVAAIDLLFLPTATGKNYVSRREEEEQQRESKGYSSSTAPPPRRRRNQKTAKEGGIEFLVEITDNDRLRVRAKRCNYGDDAIIKELSEETILSRFKKSIEVWKNDHRQMD